MKRKVYDGFDWKLIYDAHFVSDLEFPILPSNEEIIIPHGMIPFSKRKYKRENEDFMVFYENDEKFNQFMNYPNDYIREFKKFNGIVGPDNSMYLDSPLIVQMYNCFKNRSIEYFLRKKGFFVPFNIRFGDERSYTTKVFPFKFAFLGVPKNDVVSVGTYGCINSTDKKRIFKEGLKEMIKELEPKIVLVYGRMPEAIFEEFKTKTKFYRYDDYITERRKKNGNR